VKALTFEFDLKRLATAKMLGSVHSSGFLSGLGPLRMLEVPDARVLGDQWVVLETALCGVCGSDVKQVFMDAAADNPLTSVISFPHVLGHEHVGTVVDVGRAVTSVKRGDRVACSPWLSCLPRGLPECAACRAGNVSVCESFTKGAFAPGMHAGTCRDVSGGFATFVPAHESTCHRLPDEVSFDEAVLADPFAVALHAILKAPPLPGETVMVVGCGGLGAVTVHLLACLFPETKVFAVDPRAHARALATKLGAAETFGERGAALIERVASAVGAPVMRPRFALPWVYRAVDRVYDTVGAPSTLESTLRLLRPHGSLVLIGVATPGRFEWTPLYSKEIVLMGSSGYGHETLNGKRAHAIEHYLELLRTRRIDPAGVLTHRFPLDAYKDAFLMARSKSGGEGDAVLPVKIAFDFRRASA
jgi:threonine dehydrogenase-like Zn-dependent dehydrogenase